MKTPARASAPRMPTKANRDQVLHARRLSAASRRDVTLSAEARRAARDPDRDASSGSRSPPASALWQLASRGAEDRAAGRARVARAAAACCARRTWRATRRRRRRSTTVRCACAAAGSPSARVFLDNRQMDGPRRFLRRDAAAARGPARGRAGAAWLGRRATSATARCCRPSPTPDGVVEVDGRDRPAAGTAVRVRAASASGAIRQNLDLDEFCARNRLGPGAACRCSSRARRRSPTPQAMACCASGRAPRSMFRSTMAMRSSGSR